MILLLTSLAFGQQTRLFEQDEQVRSWVRMTAQSSRQVLPIVGPPGIGQLLGPVRRDPDVALYEVAQGTDMDEIARQARLERGSSCALIFSAVGEQWAGTVQGYCGDLGVAAWRFAGDRVLDFQGRPLTVTRFARSTGDREMYMGSRKFERRRGRAIALTMLGTGLLWFSFISNVDQTEGTSPARTGLLIGGVSLTGLGVLDFGVQAANPRSGGKNIGAWLPAEEIRKRVIEHNSKVQIGIGPTSVRGVF